MKCQNPFSEKIKNIINLLSHEFAHRMVEVIKYLANSVDPH